MRKILYRVYQKNFKRLLPVTYIEFKGNMTSITVDNRGMNKEYDTIPLFSTYTIDGKDFPLDSLVLLQYIGLEDKNGIDIYEGDVCEHSDKENYPRPLVVEWVEEFACFAFVDKDDFNKKYYFNKDDMDNIEVVGYSCEDKIAIIKGYEIKSRMKLELKHITPYLPYELKMDYNGKMWYIDSVILYNRVLLLNEDTSTSASICEVKPILVPLSSMTKEEAYEFGVLLMGEANMEDKEVGIGEMTLMGTTYPTITYQDKEDENYSVMIQFSSTGISSMDLIPYEAYRWLFKHHFDVFGLIDRGLAIEK